MNPRWSIFDCRQLLKIQLPLTHNTNINEAAARGGRCGTVHLPTGRMCQLPALHDGACQLTFPDPAIRALSGARGQALVGAPPSLLAGAALPEVPPLGSGGS
jgi:hypothetical protein